MAGHIISIIGGKGGVGKSQLAANLAFAYANEIRAKTLLMDFDQKACGDQNIITGLKSKKQLKELAEFSGAIDPRSIQLFTADHKAGVSYIGMPTEPILANQIQEEGLGKALKAITNIYPVTIIDAGSELTPLTLKALEFSTLIFMVTSPDLLAVNQCRRMYSDLVTLLFPKDMIQVLVNQAVNGHPVSPEVIGKQIGKPVFHAIPRDDASCVAALSRSTPVIVTAKTSAFGNGVTDCVRKLIQKNVLRTLEQLQKPSGVNAAASAANGNGGAAGPGDEKKKDQWTDLKGRIHKSLIEEMDLKKQDDNDPKAKI
ncbi:MAG: CpaE family protein, partial [Bacteriovoracaceae bacterium]